MSVKNIKRIEESVFNKFGSKEKNLENEIHKKINEENIIEKKGKEHINNISGFHINKSWNDYDSINNLKKGLNPTNYNQNALENINRNINNWNIDYINYYLYNIKLNTLNSNYCINDNIYRYSLNKRNYFLQNLKNYKELESQFYKEIDIGLKFLSDINNKNNYLLNGSRTNFYNHPIKNFNKNNKLNNYNSLEKKFNKNEQQKPKEIKKEIKDLINYPKNENKETNTKLKKNKSLINIQLISEGIEKRTVVRLHPIPQNYSSFDVSKLIDHYLHIENGKNQRIYKALYVPLSKTIGKNIGFCFIMMVEPKYVIDFFTTFNGITFNKKKSRKPCTVIWADVQGDDFLKISDDPLRSPIIFKDLICNK